MAKKAVYFFQNDKYFMLINLIEPNEFKETNNNGSLFMKSI